jgi:sulfopyruvate decarboxylase TPP-binding subunit
MFDLLLHEGIKNFIGVPDSTMKYFISQGFKKKKILITTREDEAIGIAAGMSLSKQNSLVFMQNAGFANSISTITSLVQLYEFPIIFLIGWRGYLKDDAPEHYKIGRIQPKLLRTIGVDSKTVTESNWKQCCKWAINKVKDAIKIASDMIGDSPIISANGYISRDLFETDDKDTNFYMIGSMGLSSSIALGVALKNTRKRVYVFDGDGNILMNLGSLTTIGKLKPKNLIHLVFDNQSHDSTGGQPTNSENIDLCKIAEASNYKAFKTNSKTDLQKILNKVKTLDGPIMIIIKISKGGNPGKRITYSPITIRKRFSQKL